MDWYINFSTLIWPSPSRPGPVSRSPCALLKLDVLTNAMHLLYALVRKSSFSKAQGFVKPAGQGPLRLTKVGLSDYRMHLLYALVRKSSFSKAQGLQTLMKLVPAKAKSFWWRDCLHVANSNMLYDLRVTIKMVMAMTMTMLLYGLYAKFGCDL